MVFITLLSIAVTIFRQAYLQKGFGAALMCGAAAVFLYQLLEFVIALFLGLTILSRFGGFMLTAAMSAVTIPILYPIALSIESIGGQTWKE